MVSPQIPTTVKGAGNSLPAPGKYAHPPFTFTFLRPQGTTEPESKALLGRIKKPQGVNSMKPTQREFRKGVRLQQKHLLLLLAVLCFVLVSVGSQLAAAQTTFQHPGVLVSRAQLDFIKAQVNAKVDPIYTEFLNAQKSTYGSLTYSPQGPPSGGVIDCGSFSNPDIGCSTEDEDGTAAYTQALLYWITGNNTYGQNAIRILNAYGHNLTGYTNSNGPLQAGWGASKWPRAAEIIRYSNAGWAPADAQAFGTMMTNAMLPTIINGSGNNGNWELSMIEGMIGIAVYNDDTNLFNHAVTFWHQRVPAYFYYFPVDGPNPVPAPRGSTNWNGQTVFNASVNGVAQETCRDFGHTEFGIAAAIAAAETAHIQGVDLYGSEKPRLEATLEFHAHYLLGNSVPSSVCGGHVTLASRPTFEIGYNEYHNRLGDSLPDTLNWLTTGIRTQSVEVDHHMMVFETLSHGADAGSGAPQPDFSLSASPASQTVIAGNSANYTASVSPINSFNGNVSLSVSGLPAGAASSFNPSSISGGSGSSTLNVTTSSSTPAGNYTLTATGASGSTSHTATVTLSVNAPPDFSLSATPSSQTVTAGNGTSYTATVTPSNGFNASVALTVSGAPAGVTATLSPSSLSGSGSSTLSITTSTSTVAGTYPLTITGVSGTLSHSANVTLVVNPAPVPDFTLTVSPSSQSVIVGSGSSYTATVSPVNSFSGTVALTVSGAPAGVTATLTPNSLSGSGSSTLSVTTSSSTIVGSYTLTITGTSGSLTHSANVTLVVNPPPDFSLSACSSPLTVVVGNSTTCTVRVTPINSYTGTAALSVSGLPSGATASFNPTSISGSGTSTLTISTSSSTLAGSYPLTITGTDSSAGLSHSVAVTLQVNSPPPVDFTLTASPASQTVTVGNSTTYTVTVSPVNAYAGTVVLSTSGLPAGATASFSPASVSGGSGTSTLTVTTSSSTPTNSSTLTITGGDSSAGLSHSANVTLVVNPVQQCVTATGSTWQNTAFANQTGTFTVTFDATPSASPINAVVGLSNGAQTAYTGFATLARFNPSGNIDARDGGAYNTTTIPYAGGVTYHFRMVVNIPAHTYSVFVTAPGGAEQTVGSNLAFRTEQNTVSQLNWWGAFAATGSDTVCNFILVGSGGTGDFSLAASPSALTVTAGSSTSSTVNVGATGGFSAAVALSVTGAPAGVTATLNPTSVSGSGSSTLSVSTSSSTVAGTYTLTITGTSGSLSHSASVTLTINPQPVPDFSLTASPSTQTVTAGNGTSYTATVSAINGFSGAVALGVSGAPAGVTATLSPASVSGSGTSTLTITTSSSAAAGTSTLTITGTSGSLTHSASVSLTVNSVTPVCAVTTTNGPWQNTAFANQTGTFTVAFDATPSASPINAVIGLSNGAQTAYTGFAALARFNPSGNIDARDGGAYNTTTITYSGGMTYHFRMVVNIPAHTYSVFVTAPGGAEQTVGSGLAFRTEQNTVTQLNWWGAFSGVGSETVCNFTLQ